MLKNIKLISFDAADTIIKLARTVGEHYSYIATNYGIKVNPEILNTNFKLVFSQMQPLGSTGHKDFDWWKIVIEKTFSQSGIEISQFSDYKKFEKELYNYLAEENTWLLFEDVKSILDYLITRKYRLIVFSNFDERLNTVLKNLKINEYFEQIICSTQIGFAKPDIKAFEKVAEICNLKPNEILHIGDGFENDYLGALRADFKALFLNRQKLPLYNIPDGQEIASLLELAAFV